MTALFFASRCGVRTHAHAIHIFIAWACRMYYTAIPIINPAPARSWACPWRPRRWLPHAGGCGTVTKVGRTRTWMSPPPPTHWRGHTGTAADPPHGHDDWWAHVGGGTPPLLPVVPPPAVPTGRPVRGGQPSLRRQRGQGAAVAGSRCERPRSPPARPATEGGGLRSPSRRRHHSRRGCSPRPPPAPLFLLLSHPGGHLGGSQ